MRWIFCTLALLKQREGSVAIRQMCKLKLCAVINHDCVNCTLWFSSFFGEWRGGRGVGEGGCFAATSAEKRQTAEENVSNRRHCPPAGYIEIFAAVVY